MWFFIYQAGDIDLKKPLFISFFKLISQIVFILDKYLLLLHRKIKKQDFYTHFHIYIMAKKKNQPTRTKLEEINDSLSGIEQKFEQHKNLIYIIVAAILVIALGIWAYSQFGYKPEIENAKKEIAKADAIFYAAQNGVLTAQDTTTALQVYESVAKKYGNNLIFKNKVGNHAKLRAAQILEDKGNYAEAQKYLEDYSPKSEALGPSSQILLGDIYVDQAIEDNNGQIKIKDQSQLDKGIKAYDKAIELSKESFWERIGWREIILFVLALAALAAILFYIRKKEDPKLRRLILIISAVVFLASGGFLTYLLISNKGYENKEIIAQAMQKKA